MHNKVHAAVFGILTVLDLFLAALCFNGGATLVGVWLLANALAHFLMLYED